jgi:hypothetical protein
MSKKEELAKLLSIPEDDRTGKQAKRIEELQSELGAVMAAKPKHTRFPQTTFLTELEDGTEYSGLEFRQSKSEKATVYCRFLANNRIQSVWVGATEIDESEGEYPSEGVVKVTNKRIVAFVPHVAQPTE